MLGGSLVFLFLQAVFFFIGLITYECICNSQVVFFFIELVIYERICSALISDCP